MSHRLPFFLVLFAISVLSTPMLAEVERIERGNLVIEGVPEIPPELSERLRQYENTRTATFQGWLPDGSMLISTRFGETGQLHTVSGPMAARRQITFFREPVVATTVSPNPDVNGFIFGKDVGGSEFYQLFFYDLATANHQMVTDGTSRNGGALWSNAGDRFVYYTTMRNGRDWDLHVQRVDKLGEPTPVLEQPGVWFPGEWSPDDRRLLVVRYVSANESHPHLLDLETGELEPLESLEEGEKVSYGAVAFSGDGKGIYFSSDR
ncbi:MAG: S9 family peptidase, partial [Acidobacteriota bacterium]